MFRQQNSRCGVKDLLYEEIKMINMGENMVSRRVDLFLLEEEYTQNIQEKVIFQILEFVFSIRSKLFLKFKTLD